MEYNQDNHTLNKSSNIKRIRRITKNFFLHFHSTRIHPHSLRPTYTFGLGIILGFLFLILIITGLVLMMYYSPTVERAYDSVKDITFVVPGGRYIRNIHRWAAHGMVLVVFLHMIRTFYTGSYLKGRAVNWIIGVAMLVVVLFMSFSGYLLPWDQLAYWAVTIGSNIAASARELTDMLGVTNVADIGGFIKKLLIGDETVGQSALTRFFMFHVIFLPLTLLILTAVHFWRIRKDGGLSRPAEAARASGLAERELNHSEETGTAKLKERRFYTWPALMWTELAVLLSVAAVLLIIAFIFDAPLKEQANPSYPDNPAKSPWYFLGIQELVSYSAFAGGLLIPLLFIIFLISIPYIDKEGQYMGKWFSGSAGLRITVFSIVFGLIITVLQLFILVRFGWLRDWFPDIPGVFIMLINPATLSAVFYVLWALLIHQQTRSSRMSAIAMFTCAMVGLVIFTAIGIWFRGPNWEFYWSSSQWPVQ